jgi:alpha-glucosidase
MDKKLLTIIGIIFLCRSVTVFAGNPATIEAPNGEVKVEVMVNSDGRLCYTVNRIKPINTVILEPSALGITIDNVDLGQGVKIGSVSRSMKNEKYPWRGVHSEAVNHYNGAEISITHTDSGRQYTLEVRVFPDGMGYRYIVPGSGRRTISGEAGNWNLPDDCMIWHQDVISNYEGLHILTDFSKSDPNVGLPVTVEYSDGTYGCITEAGLFAFSGMSAAINAGQSVLESVFMDDQSWTETGDISTPWRVTMTGPDLNALVNCDIVHNLCPPPDKELFPDGMSTEWIVPGRSLWNWWSDSSVAFNQQRQWVDAAVEMGFEYYLVDAGWESWGSGDMDVWACLKDLCDYAKEKGIKIQVWKHWSGLNEEGAAAPGRGGFGGFGRGRGGATAGLSRAEYFEKCAQAGASCIKVDFMDSESRARINFYTNTLIDAAKAKLMINFHGANKPTGEPRTYHNEMTREGIMGLEYNRWDQLPPTHYATLPFTRFLAGHADFTPCTLNPGKIYGTTCTLQLASAISTTSPILNFAENYNYYLKSKALEVIKEIRSVWDETIVLPGSDIGELSALARRSGSTWLVSIINGNSDEGKEYTLDLSFLGSGTYKAVYVSDVIGTPADMNVETTTATKGRKVDVSMDKGGGFVALFKLQR